MRGSSARRRQQSAPVTSSFVTSSMLVSIGIIVVLIMRGAASAEEDGGQPDVDEDSATPYVLKYDDPVQFRNEVSTRAVPHFIMFYAPWCHFCKQLAPVFNQLGQKFNVLGSMRDAIVAKVDCTKQAEICQRYNIAGYPTLLLFANGLENPVTYSGPRELENLVSYLDEQHSQIEMKQPIELTTDMFQQLPSSDDPIHFIMFYSPTCAHCKAMFPTWQELVTAVSAQMKGVAVSKVNCQSEYDLCVQEGVVSFPTFVMYKHGKREDKYDGSLDLHELMFYTEQVAKQLQQNEDIVDTSTAVVELNNENIDKVLRQGYVFINFHKPWCQFCRALAPHWARLGEKYAGQSRVVIASVDCAVHDSICSKYEIIGYPTMILFYKGERKPIYTGLHDFQSLAQYVDEMTNRKEL